MREDKLAPRLLVLGSNTTHLLRTLVEEVNRIGYCIYRNRVARPLDFLLAVSQLNVLSQAKIDEIVWARQRGDLAWIRTIFQASELAAGLNDPGIEG